MIDFVGLKALITKACKVDISGESFQDRCKFYINTAKLEMNLATKANLHYLADPDAIRTIEKEDDKEIVILPSHIPTFKDIQMVSEYIHEKAEFKSVFNGMSQIAFMVLYLDENASETDPKPVDVRLDIPDLENQVKIINDRPVYNTLVVRRFNPKADRFEYRLYFRSNYNMMDYRRDLTGKGNSNVAVSAETTTAE